MATIPPAPELPGDARLEVFVHPAGLPPNRPLEEDNKFSDARRLEYLGMQMSELAYMDVLKSRWPQATAPQLTTLVRSRINGLMERTVDAYRWRDQVRGCPQSVDKNSPQEAHRLFRTYAGAVHVEYGYKVLRDWLAALDRV
ncbi:hypothetical protein FKP32DRAFT_1632256 [Trametes sanguinea]|nr:hypothetical protein FKP32DRAFT_1632256 [Trametes sanguinea]